MGESSDGLAATRKAFRSGPRIATAHRDIHLLVSNGDLVIAGEIATITAKKLALERAAALAAVQESSTGSAWPQPSGWEMPPSATSYATRSSKSPHSLNARPRCSSRSAVGWSALSSARSAPSTLRSKMAWSRWTGKFQDWF